MHATNLSRQFRDSRQMACSAVMFLETTWSVAGLKSDDGATLFDVDRTRLRGRVVQHRSANARAIVADTSRFAEMRSRVAASTAAR
jgi:hypothetical protein